MQSILKATAGLALLAVASTASARDNAMRPDCPSGYGRLGEICVSASTGDIVLPARKAADASPPMGAGR